MSEGDLLKALQCYKILILGKVAHNNIFSAFIVPS